MNILVTGGCGFTGSYVVPELIRRGHRVCCFVRPATDRTILNGHDLSWQIGDLVDIISLTKALEDIDAIINIASIGFGHAPMIVRAAKTAGVDRAVFFSTTAIFTTLEAPSKAIRIEAEKSICESGLDYTILRPTMIYGSCRDRNMCRLIRCLKKWPIIPVVGNGKSLQQPVYVKDLAMAVAGVLSTKNTIGKCYNLSGAKPLSFNQVINTIAGLLRKRVRIIHIPARPVAAMLNLFEKAGIVPPIKAEQILRLNEDKAFDHHDASVDFGYAPNTFEEGMRYELEEIGLLP